MSDFDDFKTTYFDECAELIGELEVQFAAIAEGDRAGERLNAVFRAIHSIKGGAGAFGFTTLVKFTHAFETLLDQVRDHTIALTDEVVALSIRSVDIVADLVAAARLGDAVATDFGATETARFDALSRGEASEGQPFDDFDIDFIPVRVNFDDRDFTGDGDSFGEPPLLMEPIGSDTGYWEIRFTPHRALYARANDPLLLFRELAQLGEMQIAAEVLDLPALADFEPFGVYCTWTITIIARQLTEATIREVFEFVEGDCELGIVWRGEPLAPAIASPGAAPTGDAEDSMPAAPDTAADPVVMPEPQRAAQSFADLAATMVSAPFPVSSKKPAVSAAGSFGVDAGSESRSNGVQSIRVDLDKVDRVVNMVGELVITQSMLTQQLDDALRARYPELVRGLEVLAETTRELQDAVMAIRAQPVRTVFNRLPRLVRELALQTGKQIRLETVGEATEIDKTIIEQLSDPLTHMVRNSADHGIESPEQRLAAGKPDCGIIRLSAEQAGGNILIIVEDDGAGIDRERVLQVARSRGIIGADQSLTNEQIDQLIFAPGFSTAEAVNDISGRGVGMDVVLSNIKRIGGSVQVRSWPGQGTRMTLRLPLTLAVLDVMLIRVAGNPYVIPLSSIIETIAIGRAEFSRAPSGARLLSVRGAYLQVVDIGASFQLREPTEGDGFVVVCEAEGATRVALLVDDIIGQQQVVIKSLEENFERIEGIAGGTILGDGKVALIIDVQSLQAVALPRRMAA